jgi:beta-N-acetylhexosaminidase
MRLVVAPSLNFNLAQLGSVIAAGVGGVLFLGSGAPPSDLAKLVATAQANPVGGVPVLTMADEEGGGIQRLNGLVLSFAWPRQLAAGDSTAKVESLAHTVGTQLRAAGVDMDLAPVLDVDGGAGPNNQNPDGERSFSAVPSVAASYGVAFLEGLAAGGELSTVKHFPGLGGSTGNSDAGPAHTLPFATLQAQAYPPFRAAIAAGAPAVMVANDTVPGLTTTPASLSATVIQGQLRDALKFHGAVVTDSLSAGAISSAGYTVPEASVAAVEAGADLVLFGATGTTGQISSLAPSQVLITVNNIASALAFAVSEGALSESAVDEAVAQVVALTRVNLCGHSGT